MKKNKTKIILDAIMDACPACAACLSSQFSHDELQAAVVQVEKDQSALLYNLYITNGNISPSGVITTMNMDTSTCPTRRTSMPRPSTKNKLAAIALGDKTYRGSTHIKCGTSEKYVKSNQCCVACHRSRPMQAAKRRQAEAKASGKIMYLGLVCSKCESALRYTSNQHCVQCQRRGNNQRRANP